MQSGVTYSNKSKEYAAGVYSRCAFCNKLIRIKDLYERFEHYKPYGFSCRTCHYNHKTYDYKNFAGKWVHLHSFRYPLSVAICTQNLDKIPLQHL